MRHEIDLAPDETIRFTLPSGELVRLGLNEIRKCHGVELRAALGIEAPRHIEIVRDDAIDKERRHERHGEA